MKNEIVECCTDGWREAGGNHPVSKASVESIKSSRVD